MEKEIGRKLDFNEVVHHLNEDKLDNDIGNLRIMTRAEHSRLHAKPPYFSEYARQRSIEYHTGKPARNRKLSEDDVVFIKEHYIPRDKTYGGRALGRKFGVDHFTISKIIHGEFYKTF